jgi:hypothetical protein
VNIVVVESHDLFVFEGKKHTVIVVRFLFDARKPFDLFGFGAGNF